MVQTFSTMIKNMEVRKVEETEIEINEKIYRSLLVYFDDENCDRLIFKDKNIENISKYERGTVGTLELTISTDNITKTSKAGNTYIAEKTTIIIKDFIPNKKSK